jgi:NADH dehydrogenase
LRVHSYDTLVVAVGSATHDRGVPGVEAYAITLEAPADAARFRRGFVSAFIRAQSQSEPLRPEQRRVAIVGAGAVGVELAAELRNTARDLVAYGFDRIDAERGMKLVLLDAAERILPSLPPHVSALALERLRTLGVEVRTSAHVAEILPTGITLTDGTFVPAELTVWAAGAKAPKCLASMDGLETNHLHQLSVLPTLQTTRDENIFAIGDCAACPWPDHSGDVPPRAQAAHQQAAHLFRERYLSGKALQPFRYRDFGSLSFLGRYRLLGVFRVTQLMYRSIGKMHQRALHGSWRVMLDTILEMRDGRAAPRIKLH